MKYKPVIVVTAFNRPDSVSRLLRSLSGARNLQDVRLIISIDNNEPDNFDVREIAESYDWPFGNKEVIYREERMGLRKHIMHCAALSDEYGAVIMLEDDLFVSPYFYEYAVEALEYYSQDPDIAGISLYNQPVNEMNLMPFRPAYDDSDVYFLIFPSSLGQVWTRDQWKAFTQWYEKNQEAVDHIIPRPMLKWPHTSWKKLFSAYLIAERKYFVFPRFSLTTNFNDPGTHEIQKINYDGQSQLRLTGPEYRFKNLSDSYCRYDHLLEMEPDCIRRLNPRLEGYDFTMDLYGLKEIDKIESPFIITSKPMKRSEFGFQRALKPHEMNIIFDLPGNELLFGNTKDLLTFRPTIAKEISDYKYYFFRFTPSWKAHLNESIQKYRRRIKRKIKRL